MRAKAKSGYQGSFLLPTLREQLDARQGLYKLGEKIPWKDFEQEFGSFYSEEGRPAKPIRLMVGLLLLKQLHNLGDETVVEQWVQNPYFQFFCGQEEFSWSAPCEPSDLVHFRHRIGEGGIQIILAMSAGMHGKKAQEKEVVVDTTVQEKAITYPTDSKLHRKIIVRCWQAADQEGVKLRRRYRKEVRKCVLSLRGWRTRHGQKAARRGARKLKTIAARLVRELGRKLSQPGLERQQEKLALYARVLKQKPSDSNKVYSLHESHVYCVSKGKEHKKYEFGTKASLAMTKTHGIIVGALALETNQYDGHTLPEVLEQVEAITGEAPEKAIVDRGYRGKSRVGETEVLVPGTSTKHQSTKEIRENKGRFRRRCAIEPTISHLKHRFRLCRNWLKGFEGDSINVMLAAAAWNLRKWMILFCAWFRFSPSSNSNLWLLLYWDDLLPDFEKAF
jgi:IS5 family transposase